MTATVTGINADVDGKVITLVPLAASGTVAFTAIPPAPSNMGQGLFGWRCGNDATDGTNLAAKFLPGSCRGV